MSNLSSWQQLKDSTENEIVAWARQQPFAQEMADCMQDPLWHAEGDVWTHTEMVCAELLRLPMWTTLSKEEQVILLLTAIFHDAGKPATTCVEEATGRIRSPKHAQFGMRIARRTLFEMGCEFRVREAICNLVLFHGRPPFLSKNERPAWELIKLSGYVDHRLLYWFALADTRGRVCNEHSTSHPEEVLEMWKLVAEENDCLGKPFRFANDHARFLFYRGSLDNLNYAPHEAYRCTMTVMCGLPGSGKDSWVEQENAETQDELPVVSLDHWRKKLNVSPDENQGVVVQAGREQCREFLRSETDFVFNATNTTRQIRKLWIDLGADYNARIKIVYVEPLLEVLLQQNAQRDDSVPDSVIQRLIDKLDPPTLTECHELQVISP